MRIGVLALQGDWEAHTTALAEAGAAAEPIRAVDELARVKGLVLPGGESTAILRLMDQQGLADVIVERARHGMPLLATCAGVILLASSVEPSQPSLRVLDVDVRRNAYGRQVHSTVTTIDVEPEVGEPPRMEGVFIRAPRITRHGPQVRVLGRRSGEAVLVAQARIVATTFHPELSGDRRIHQLFCRLAEDSDG